jgi:peroxiredoxin
VLEVGDQVPAALVQRAPGDETTLAALAVHQPILLVFYLFDWSST